MVDVSLNNYTIFYNILPNITDESIYTRLMSQLPPWFGNNQHFTRASFNISNKNSGTLLNTILWSFNCTSGNISVNATDPYNFYGNYAQYQYILAQMRLGIDDNNFMTDFDQLNLFAKDFFGNNFPRFPNENNPTYKSRIHANLMNIRATRPALFDLIKNMTGNDPILFEPWNVFDAMFYGFDDTGTIPISHCAYGFGKYGSASLAYNGYIDIFMPPNQGLGNYPGFDLPPSPTDPPLGPATWPPFPTGTFGAYGNLQNQYSAIYGSASFIQNIVTEAQILRAINATKTYGTVIWVSFIYST